MSTDTRIEVPGVEITSLADIEAVVKAWREVEADADSSFFVSADWTDAWLRSLPEEALPLLARIALDDDSTALALLGRTRTRRRKVIRSRVLALHETGDRELDIFTVEHNRLLARAGAETNAWHSLLTALAHRPDWWDELRVSAVTRSERDRVLAAADEAGLDTRLIDSKPYYFVNLQNLRESGQDYLGSLSGNTRYQVRRSAKLYEQEYGEVTLRNAESVEEALAFFSRLCELHEAYWNKRGLPGAFATQLSEAFHRRLITNCVPEGHAQLTRIRAGDHEIGYLYNFVYRGTVSSYQSGFNYSADNRVKPGLLCHCLAVEKQIEAGEDVYDFLMGRSQYKSSLSTDEGEMSWLSIQRPRLVFRLEALAQRIKARLNVTRNSDD
ncbi:MAG: GNAT family N-acetyltransferase [Deltaproteobacteria bacterium]|nr:GNAT family N-acetyltransferase [Deltaproteobacteria bacterium]